MKKLAFVLCISCSVFSVAQNIKPESLKKHISYLASDKLKGRGTSSAEELMAANYIAKQFKAAGLSNFNNSYLKGFTYKYNPNRHDTSSKDIKEQAANNVVGYLNNKAVFTIVIGAHYDHLGLGYDHNSKDANPEGKIHNGADDNASGTAGVIELANYFSNNKKTEPFNILFVCFSGEELGLLGSKKYCDNPDVDLNTVNYMINMDMIGRLNDSTKKVLIYGVGTSPVWVPLIDSLKSEFKIIKDSSGIGPSDQTSFYLKDIPVLHFFTGQHSDYHKPSDDIEKVNYKGESAVLDYIIATIEKTYHYPKLAFLKTRNPESSKAGFRVTMGVMPDYTYEGEGLHIEGVTDGKPANKAGVLKDDIVIRLGTTKVKNIQDYMKALSTFKKGDNSEVEVLRNGKNVVLPITF
ncbi:MAG: M20/M25/M40 family metallo-hydrolase [Bacteroidota bacterium]|nr:M20/M25/M40 family metallo-hydrolase [Bacteroidota bacterium]